MPQEKRMVKNTIASATMMPHSDETEQALLGCILLDNEIQNDVLVVLSDDDFYSPANRTVFTVMKSIIAGNTPLDFITLADKLEKEGKMQEAGGIENLTLIAQSVASVANYKKYLNFVKRDGVLRRLIRASGDIAERAYDSEDPDDAISFAEKSIFDIAQNQNNDSLVQARDIVPAVLHKLDVISRDKNAYFGIRTGFERLDRITNGLQNGDMIVVGARPSCGKTSLGMNIIENAAIRYGKKCAVFSLEMGKEQLVERMMYSVAEVDSKAAKRGELKKADWKRLEDAREHIAKADISINDMAIISPKEILSICRRLKRKHGLDLILIDYIGLMDNDDKKKSNTRQNDVSEVSRGLKALAKDINVPVIVLAQLSRASVTTGKNGGMRRPQLSDLRESGSIEQDADIVMFIHRPDKDINLTAEEKLKKNVKDNVAEILVEKQRNGETGMFKLYFKGECTKFVDYDEESSDAAPQSATEQNFQERLNDIETDVEDLSDDNEFEYDDGTVDKDVFD